MMIYTGMAAGKDMNLIMERGMGIMISSSCNFEPRRSYSGVPCALDNGAFQCWRRGFPFQSDVFRRTVAKAYEVGLTLDFLVCPDIVGGGIDSLEFSMSWATGELRTAHKMALAVQDGMTVRDINSYHAKHFSHLFIGGTPSWKWANAADWVEHAHMLGLKAHIGQVGTLPRLRAARDMGADSVDSTSFVRNKSWHIIDEFHGGCQSEMFPFAPPDEYERKNTNQGVENG